MEGILSLFLGQFGIDGRYEYVNIESDFATGLC